MKNLFALLIILTHVKLAGAQLIISEKDADSPHALIQYARIADVGDRRMSIDEFRRAESVMTFKPLGEMNEKIGFTAHHFWVTFSIRNATERTLNYYLETARPITDEVNLYSEPADGVLQWQQSGDAIPFEQRDFSHRKSIFRITIPAGAFINYYIHMKSDGEVINMPIKLNPADQLIRETYTEQLVYGIFYGLLILACITYLFFYFALKDRTFLYYSLYVGCVGMMQFSIDGFFFQYFGNEGGFLSARGVILFALLSTFFFGKYAQWFLSINYTFTWLPKAFLALYVAVTALLLCVMVWPSMPEFSYPAANLLALVVLGLVIIAVISLYTGKAQTNPDPFFTTGILFLVAGFAIFILDNFSLVNHSFITENSPKLGTGLEVIFLSLSMSNRIRKLRSEKEHMQTLALKRSEDLNELKSYFMSNMSHELRTPLNAIMGIADVMLREARDEKARDNFEVIKYASLSLLSSVNDILDFSKIEKGELILDSSEFSPGGVIDQLRFNAEKQARDKGLVFNYEVSGNIPELIIGDGMRLTQIINNVLSNAIKFTQAGWINFKVTAIKKGTDQTELTIVISDSGIGIPKEKIDSVFDSFIQEQINNKRKYGGLGLGLSIVKRLVDLHGGTISIESKVNTGTQCTITLPFKVAPSGNQTVTKYPVHEFDLLGSRLLVVEDNLMNQMLIKKMLKNWKNTSIEIVNNGQEALDAIQHNRFDLVLMDLQMPVMDGYEASAAIRAGATGVENISLPIIAVTADAMEGTKQRVKEIGMDDYITKPISQDVLYKSIISLLVKRAAMEQV